MAHGWSVFDWTGSEKRKFCPLKWQPGLNNKLFQSQFLKKRNSFASFPFHPPERATSLELLSLYCRTRSCYVKNRSKSRVKTPAVTFVWSKLSFMFLSCLKRSLIGDQLINLSVAANKSVLLMFTCLWQPAVRCEGVCGGMTGVGGTAGLALIAQPPHAHCSGDLNKGGAEARGKNTDGWSTRGGRWETEDMMQAGGAKVVAIEKNQKLHNAKESKMAMFVRKKDKIHVKSVITNIKLKTSVAIQHFNITSII